MKPKTHIKLLEAVRDAIAKNCTGMSESEVLELLLDESYSWEMRLAELKEEENDSN